MRPPMPARPTVPEQPSGTPRVRRATAASLKTEIDLLQAKIAELEGLVADRQTAFRAADERDRAESLLAELLRMTAELMSARETSARLEGELNALRLQRSQQPWWWRLLPG